MNRALFSSVLALALAVGAGCAAPVEPATDASTGAVSEGGRRIVRSREVTIDLPPAHLIESSAEIFSTVDELRSYFAESCGYFCSKPFAGPVPFQITGAPQNTAVVAYVGNPKVPAGRELVIATVHGQANARWLSVTTCTRPGPTRRFALALVEAEGTLPLTWISANDASDGLAPCR